MKVDCLEVVRRGELGTYNRPKDTPKYAIKERMAENDIGRQRAKKPVYVGVATGHHL